MNIIILLVAIISKHLKGNTNNITKNKKGQRKIYVCLVSFNVLITSIFHIVKILLG
jgi:hypothetical protein